MAPIPQSFSATGPPAPLAPIAVVPEFADEVVRFINAAMPSSTESTYRAMRAGLAGWCASKGIPSFPISGEVLARYMMYLHEVRGLARNTINCVVPAAVGAEYKYSPYPNPADHPLVRGMRKAVASLTAPSKGRARLPLTHEQLNAIASRALAVAAAEPPGGRSKEAFLAVRDTLMILLSFSAMLRSDNVVRAEAEHVTVEQLHEAASGPPVTVLAVYTPRSKVDQQNAGHSLVVPETGGVACAVAWRNRWESWRDRACPLLFHGFGKRKRLAASTLNGIVKRRLEEAGFDASRYGGQSGRKGGATAAFAAGAPLHAVKRHGAWKTDTAAFMYLHDSLETQLAVGRAAMPRAPAAAAPAGPERAP